MAIPLKEDLPLGEREIPANPGLLETLVVHLGHLVLMAKQSKVIKSK